MTVAVNPGEAPSRVAGSGSSRKSLVGLALSLAMLLPSLAEADRGEGGWFGRGARSERHFSQRRDYPHNARYKNPPRFRSGKREVVRERYDRHARWRDGRRDHEHHHRNGKHHDGYRHYDRPTAYHHRRYAPHYGHAAYSYPYYCDRCYVGFQVEHVFHEHVHYQHHVPFAVLSSILIHSGSTVFFFSR